jgi:hypothetical protein
MTSSCGVSTSTRRVYASVAEADGRSSSCTGSMLLRASFSSDGQPSTKYVAVLNGAKAVVV